MKYRTIPFKDWLHRETSHKIRTDLTKNMTIKDIERFCSKIDRGKHCWEFISNATSKWPRFDGKLAHRVSYELFVQEIPYGLTIDHLCLNKWCVNPDHLEPVSSSENTKRWNDYKKGGTQAVPQYKYADLDKA